MLTLPGIISGGAFAIADPTDIAGLALWLDGSDASTMYQAAGSQPFGLGSNPVTGGGQYVECWADKSGNGNHVNQATSTYKPTYETAQQNGLSALYCNNKPYLYSTSPVLTQVSSITTFYVAHAVSDESVGTVFATTNVATERLDIYLNTKSATPNGINFADSSGSNFAAMPSDIGTEWNQHTAIVSGGYITARLNGAAGTPTFLAGDQSCINDYTRVFNRFSNGSPLYGRCGELIVYDAALTSAEIKAVETYLKNKWATP